LHHRERQPNKKFNEATASKTVAKRKANVPSPFFSKKKNKGKNKFWGPPFFVFRKPFFTAAEDADYSPRMTLDGKRAQMPEVAHHRPTISIAGMTPTLTPGVFVVYHKRD